MPASRRPAGASGASAGPARAAALRLLGRREYTRAELVRKLSERGYAPADVESTLQRLAGEGLLDDRRVAAAHVRVASRVKGRGRLRIARELDARGIDADIVRETLAALPEEEDAEALARILSRRNVPPRLSMAERRKVFQQMLRRGFPSDAIARALRARASEGPGDDPDDL